MSLSKSEIAADHPLGTYEIDFFAFWPIEVGKDKIPVDPKAPNRG